MSSNDEQLRTVVRTMIRARIFEESLGDEFAKQREHAKRAFGGRNGAFEDHNAEYTIPIQGNIELSIGQEAAAAALCSWLNTDDYAAGTHRSHALAIAKGVRMDRILAEIYGRATGLVGGRGGDFMLNDPDVNFENSAIMAQLTGVALGHAFAHRRQSSSGIAAVFIGDGASNQGIVHEAMNLAALWALPVIFVIEDNGYAISTERARSSSVEDLAVRALAYGMPGRSLDDSSLNEIVEGFGSAVARARSGAGPGLVVVHTHRLRGAFEGDNQSYRPAGELEREARRDALALYVEDLLSRGIIDAVWLDEARSAAIREFEEGLSLAEASPYPDPATAQEGLFA